MTMTNELEITRRQTPIYRALIRSEQGEYFDPETDLATATELEAEGIDAPPVGYTVYRFADPFAVETGDGAPVVGFEDVPIAPEEAFVDGFDFNFQFAPTRRVAFPFAEPGLYAVDFAVYPKVGPPIVFRVPTTVR